MKTIFSAIAVLMLGTTLAAAEAPEFFRAAGCDPEGLKPIFSADGATVLYYVNIEGWSGCTSDTGRGPDANDLVAAPPVAPVDPDEGEGDNGHEGEDPKDVKDAA